MFEYIDASGQIYTEDQINKMAAEQKTSANAIIKDKGLKRKSSGASASAKPAKKTYPWSDQTKQKKSEGDFLGTFKKAQKNKKANIKKSTEEVSAFVGKQNDYSFYQKDPIQDILNPPSELDKAITNIPIGKPKQEFEILEEKEAEVMNYIKGKPIDYASIDKLYADEVNDSQTIDYVREGAKGFLNDVILSPVSMVGQALGADIDMTISPYKPLETQKKKAIDILSKANKKGQKINATDVDALAKEIFYKEQVLIQEGKAAEEYWDDQPLYIGEVAAQKEKLKIRAVQDVLVSSDLARQQTILAKTYNSQLSSFEKYANLFKDKYTKGEVTEEEIATYETRREDARKAMDNLKGIADNYPAYVDKIKTDEEKLEYFKYNYDDVTANLSKFIGTGINILGGATKLIGSTIEYAEGDEKGLGGLLGEVGTANIEMGNKIKEDAKNISFDNVNSFGDFGKYFAGLVSEQLPIYAAMYFGGNYGLTAVSMGAGGQKIQEMEDEIGSDYDLGTKLLAGYGFALSEFIPEKLGTLRMFDNMKKTMSSVSSQSRQIFKDSFIKSSLKTAGMIGVESQIEGATEVVTEGLNMLLDEHLLGQPVSSTDRVKRFKEAYAGGAFMGGGAQFAGGVSTLVAKELKNYATDKELAASKNLMDRIDFLQNELQTNSKLSGKESEEIVAEIKRLSNEAVKVIENSEDRVYDMSNEDMVDVLNINKQQKELRDAYIELSQSNFSPEIKKEKVAELKKQFGELENKREYLLTGKYAEINKMIGNRTIINSGADNIRKIVASLGEENIENRIGDQGSIAVFEDTDSLKKAYKEWLTTENNTIKKKIADGELPANTKIKSEDEITNDVNEAAKTDGFALPNGQSVINLSVASRTGAINVAQHEFLHKVLSKALSNPVERKKIVNGFLATLTNKERAVVQKRIDENYLNPETGKIDDENLEEYFTAFVDAIAYGEIGDRNQVKDVLRRAARPVLKVLQKLGFSNAKFSEGRDFYDFLKEYQSNASKGRISNRAKALLDGASVARPIRYSKSIEERMDDLDEQLNDGEIDYDTYEKKMIALEKEEAEMKRKEYEEKKAETGKEPEVKKADKKATKPKEPKSKEDIEISEIAAKAKAKLDAIGNDPKGFNPGNPAIYDELAKMVKVKSRNWRTNKGTVIDFTNKDKGGLDGFSLEEMVSYVRTSMIPYIAKFDPSKNNSLYGYINAQYINRMRGALKSGEVADVVFTEDVTEMTKLSAEDFEPTRPSLPERKRFQNILESGVFSPDVIENIQEKILPVVRTLRAAINETTSLNRTVSPIISEIRDEMGKQADIDIKKAMGGKENQELQNWLITNKKTILENMTTTWLMGKDMGNKVAGGMPFAIQKRVNGRWINYPEWVGKKIDRESVDVDLAGRTAGHEMVRRLPEVNRNVETMEYLSSIIDLETGNPIRGRKESLAKALAEEVSFDIISDDLSTNGPIAQALNRNQQLKGAVVEDIIVEEFNRLAERGNVKFSISNTNIDLNAAARFMIDSKGNMDIINAAINNKSKNYNINEFQKLYKYITKYGVTDEDLKYLIDKYSDVSNEVAGPLMNDKEVKFSKSLENNLNSYNKSDKGITLVSDYIAENNIKRIDAETAFDVLNDLNKSIEDWWSVVENKTIEGMMSSVDYAFDVIEDRENEGGPMMAAVNNALNLETIKFAEKQLNDWISNDTKWKARPKFSKSLSVLSQFNDISKSEKEFIDISEKFVKDVMNKSGLNRKAIQLETLTVKEDNELYNFDQEYQELYDKDYDGTITEAERARMEEIYKSNVLAKKVNKILEIYNKAKINSNNNDIVNAVESSMPKKALAPVKFSKSLDYEFNDMLERNKGVPSYESISDIVAKRKGAKVNRFSFFIPPSADDFIGLTSYMFAGKGKQGELDQQFFDRNLIIPYVKGINTLDTVRQSIKKSYKELLSSFPKIKSKLEKLIPDKSFTYDQAVRVYLWAKNDIDIPGLNRIDKNKLIYLVKKDPDLIAFAEALSIAGRQDGGWWKPSTTWDSETIISDLHNITEGDGRKMWLEEFIENANAIFSKENLNKVQSIYGTSVRVALEDALYRMKNGKNRPEGTDALTNRWMNWINGSTAAIMFFNLRSAILQTISTTNYLNWSDNNPLMAAKAFANQKQYWTDFAMILNSDKLKERRSGLKSDVTQSEIANAANNAKDKARGVLSYLQKKGFTPTQAADSFAIALGGSTFYRNRVNTYLSKADEDGNWIHTEKEAEDLAWLDFSRATDQSMQSADPLYVSKQQTTSLGRLVLAFANTPLQYSRIMKKAALDLVNKRGDWKTNISKIVYYGFLQNMIFSYLQAAMFLPFDDEEEDIANMTKEQKKEYEKLKKKQDDKAINILNGMADTLLRGSGITGALISTIKNVYMEYDKQEKREMFADHAYTIIAAAGISPPISSKVRKLYGAHRTKKFDKDVIAERGWEITKDGKLNLSPNYQIVGNIAVATTNIPLDRVVEKVNNVSEALDSRNTKLQRTALMLGWKAWELNVKNEESEAIKTTAKEVRKKEGVEKAIETRERKADSIKQMIKEMPSAERSAYLRKQKLERREKTIEKRKKAIAKKNKRRMGGD